MKKFLRQSLKESALLFLKLFAYCLIAVIWSRITGKDVDGLYLLIGILFAEVYALNLKVKRQVRIADLAIDLIHNIVRHDEKMSLRKTASLHRSKSKKVGGKDDK